MAPTVVEGPAEAAPPRDATPAEVRAIIDRQAWRYLGISGAEFVRRWKSGYWPNPDAVPGVTRVAMLLPFAQKQ
jgi:hypothetical protein